MSIKNDNEEYRYDVFISYSRRDRKKVIELLLVRLERLGIRVCIDCRDFEPGAPSITEMERAVKQSRKTLLAFSKNYLNSGWTEFENIIAQTLDPAGKNKRIIPTYISRCNDLTFLDLSKPDQFEGQFGRLITAIRGHKDKTQRSENKKSVNQSEIIEVVKKHRSPFERYLQDIDKTSYSCRLNKIPITIIFLI